MMADLSPREPYRPLVWPDIVYDLQHQLRKEAAQVYIVGGAVRDALLQRSLTDIDLATPENGIKLARRIANMLEGDFFPLDTERDVGRVLVDTAEGRFVIDVARFRGDDLYNDLADRDFTINAMAVELGGDLSLLIDPLGGEQDVQAKIIRHCHDTALQADPLRTLRAVRQSVQLAMRIEPVTLAAIHAAAPRLPEISAERMRDEFIKMLALERPRMALRVADSLGLLETILPEVRDLRAQPADEHDNLWQRTLAVVEKLAHILAAISPHRTDHTGATFGVGMLVMQIDRYRSRLQEHINYRWPNERPHTALMILSALETGGQPDSAVDLVADHTQTLRLSNDERDRLKLIARHWYTPFRLQALSPLALHRFWWQVGESGVDICLLAAAYFLGAAGSKIDQDEWLLFVERLLVLLAAYYEQYDTIVAPPVLIDGNQLMKRLDLVPGPVIGDLLTVIREGQVTGEVLSVDDAIQLAQAHLAQNS